MAVILMSPIVAKKADSIMQVVVRKNTITQYMSIMTNASANLRLKTQVKAKEYFTISLHENTCFLSTR